MCITETEKDKEQTEETSLLRTKKLTKTNPAARINHPVRRNDYSKHRKKTESVTTHRYIRVSTEAGQRRRPVDRPQYPKNPSIKIQPPNHGFQDIKEQDSVDGLPPTAPEMTVKDVLCIDSFSSICRRGM